MLFFSCDSKNLNMLPFGSLLKWVTCFIYTMLISFGNLPWQVTLRGFRAGNFMTLVATNVAARGLDINDVQLIIQV